MMIMEYVIITPVRNEENFLPRLVESIVNQTYFTRTLGYNK